MSPPKVSKKKKGEPPPVDKLIKPAIGVGLALLAYQFFKGLRTEIPRINVLDELELRQVFFGEGNADHSYAVLCHEEDSTIPISSVFQDAYNEGKSPALFRVVDCNHVLSSGKSIVERFKLDTKNRPTIFVSGAGVEQPIQVSAKFLKTGAMLTKYLKGKLETRAAKIETTQDLRSKCLDKNICALLLKGSTTSPNYLKDAMGKLLKEFPNVAFASMDFTVLYALNLEEHLPELTAGQPRFVVLKKQGGSVAVGGGRLITSIAPPIAGSNMSYLTMSNLVGGVVSGSVATTKISSLPVVKTRSKKLEEQERAKRERKSQRQTSGSADSDSASSSEFSANDGSAEGRRLERERRREEHRATHNVKPKTPEEIAEIERQRRIRMAEEAAKWNIAPDDVPDEGEPVSEEYLEDLSEDEYTAETSDVNDYEEESADGEEDVMDLD